MSKHPWLPTQSPPCRKAGDREGKRSRIKICGLRRRQDIEAVNRWKPDYCGFIFCQRSRRFISFDQAADLKGLLDPGIVAVGVFVNEDPARIAACVSRGIIDGIQLHGQEDQDYLDRLRSLLTLNCQPVCPIMQAFSIRTGADLERAEASQADMILLDHGSGGTGEAFDWSLLKQVRRPYFLAGGLNPDNVAQAVKEYHPYGLDISSGVETDGWKDPQKIETCIRRIRNV